MSKLNESRTILMAFGLPSDQQNEAAAYTLLALAGLAEDQAWNRAGRETMRIHDLLQFIRIYGKHYAENTRETIRRRVLHQFEQARIVDRNRDDPARPTNSGKTCYSLTSDALAVIVAYGTDRFLERMADFQSLQSTLMARYQKARRKHAVEIDPELAASNTGAFRWNPWTGVFLEFDENLECLFGIAPTNWRASRRIASNRSIPTIWPCWCPLWTHPAQEPTSR